MPTLERAWELVRDFERDYPDQLADQLAWWVKVLGIPRVRMLRLIGLSRVEIARGKGHDWSRVVHLHPSRSALIESLLRQLLAEYSYDTEFLSAEIRAAARPIPSSVSPGFRRVVTPSALIHSAMLIKQIRGGGPLALKALKRFLAGE